MIIGVTHNDLVPRIDCPYCQVSSHATERQKSAVVAGRMPLTVSAAFQCDNCKHLLVASAVVPGVSGDSSDYASMALNALDEAAWTWEPKTVVGKAYSDVPSGIAEPASEAHACWSIGAYRSTVLLSRAVIEAGAKDKGIGSGNLYDKIAKLSEQGYIRPLIADAAHEVRLLGNDMAHGDFATTSISAEDAGEVLDLLDVFIAEMFELPGKIARRKTKRQPDASS